MKKYLILLILPFLVMSCSSDDDAQTVNYDEENTNAIQLRSDATHGNILTDVQGKTLYFFSLDHKGDTSFCSGGCADAWPAFYTNELTLDNDLLESDFGVITRDDGSLQTTYKGWPLYYFSNDAEAGQINGDGVGETWFVAKPDYSLILVSAQLVGSSANGDITNLTSTYEPGDGRTFYITDDRGNTLYRFTPDSNGQNNFTANDFSNNGVWPIFSVEVTHVPSVLNVADFNTIDVFGRPQLTYRGWPLYKFQQDTGRGDNFGVGFPQPGIWPIVNQNTEIAPQG
jgi:predicted lipoprotein with Yx(FWY)xxD motif